jgi:predicted transcriptional regulator
MTFACPIANRLGRQGISSCCVRYYGEVQRGSVAIGSQRMQAILLSREEVARRAKQLYENGIRQKVEVEENIGKMVIIDIETGDYEVDKTGLQASRNLSKKHPNARLFGIRIGYNVAVSFGGLMERVDK